MIETCVWRGRGERPLCGAPGSFYHCFILCDQHKIELADKMSVTARQSAKFHPIGEFPGICYAVVLPSGLTKIGYSNSEKLFKSRLTTLKSEAGGAIAVIATIPGGFVAEAMLHYALREYRVPGLGELFDCAPTLVLAEAAKLTSPEK